MPNSLTINYPPQTASQLKLSDNLEAHNNNHRSLIVTQLLIVNKTTIHFNLEFLRYIIWILTMLELRTHRSLPREETVVDHPHPFLLHRSMTTLKINLLETLVSFDTINIE